MSEPAARAEKPAGRIQIIDAVRGGCILLMIAYHIGFDLYDLGLMARETLYNPLLNTLEPLFAGVFIVLSGVSARYARDNRARGLRVLGCALVVSLASGVVGAPIPFGILHCLGCCMVLCGDPAVRQDRIPRRAQPFLFGGLFIVCYVLLPVWDEAFSAVPYLYMFGFVGPEYPIVDYFPLLRWFFLYPLGAWLGLYIREGRMPRWFYTARIPVLPAVGRRALVIYMLHQPVIYGALYLFAKGI